MVGVPIAAGVIYPAGARLDASWAALLMALRYDSHLNASLTLVLSLLSCPHFILSFISLRDRCVNLPRKHRWSNTTNLCGRESVLRELDMNLRHRNVCLGKKENMFHGPLIGPEA